MSKNIIPMLIVLSVVGIGILGVYLVLNQKTSISSVDLNIPNTKQENSLQEVKTVTPSPMPTQASTFTPISSQVLPDGLKIEDEKIGTGSAVKSGDTIVIHYLGTLTNGEKFDSSYDRNQPFETKIGVGEVIKGWDEGVIGMQVGGKRRLTIPPSLGYGDQAAGSIPPKSTLVFELELLEIK